MKKILLNTVRAKSPRHKKYSALISDEDFEKVSQHNWTVFKSRDRFYAQTHSNGRVLLMHNFIMGCKWIDHIDRNGLNNQRDNLRKATRSQNQGNRGKQKNTKNNFKGVKQCSINRWTAYIMVENKRYYLGCFKSEIEAAQAYDNKAIELRGEFAYPNLIQTG